MPPDAIDFRQRAQLAERLDEPCSDAVLRAYLRDLARVNRWFMAYRPVLQWLDSLGLEQYQPIHVLGVGCGYGDGLRRIEKWAHNRSISMRLTGVDLNPDTVKIAEEATSASSRIQWISSDVFSFGARDPVDIVVSSLFTHHLDDASVMRFLRWMEDSATLGWFINDLSRNVDGPVSIARAFVQADWKRSCGAAGLDDGEVSIKSFTPARLCVGWRKRR